jgi:SNF2 domain-containing protein/helicase-like protein/restriction endonuclease
VTQWFIQDSGKQESGWCVEADEFGLQYSRSERPDALVSPILESALVQWMDAGQAVQHEKGWSISWDSVFQLLADTAIQSTVSSLGIPPQIDIAPRLESRGSLSDNSFAIIVSGWTDPDGRRVQDAILRGAVVKIGERRGLVPKSTWILVKRIGDFARRPATERNELAHRLAWSEIRSLALAAGARLDDFLFRTVVLSPERLKIGLRRSGIGRSSVIEVAPGFEGSPDQWLQVFDANNFVRDRYDLPTPNGIVQVVVRPNVRTVLEQIKRLPGRRVAGTRAEAFIANPFAALGAAASEVIDADEFEAEKERAGISFDRFTSFVDRDAFGFPTGVGLLIEGGPGPTSTSERLQLKFSHVAEFSSEIRTSIGAGRQLCAWREYEFELLGNVEQELERLEQAYKEWKGTAPLPAGPSITIGAVYDLSSYSERIQGFGEEKPYVSPYIGRKDEKSGWFPDNIVNIIELPPERPGDEPRFLPLTERELAELKKGVEAAKAAGESTIQVPRIPAPVPISEIEDVIKSFGRAASDAKEGKLEERIRENKPLPRKGLVVKANVGSLDYLERRRETLTAAPDAVELPIGLRPTSKLKQHQLDGVAWLQHLFRFSPDECRGALLADDMGLGKTLQLLTLVAWARETNPSLEPALIVAPVALLENWRDEAKKFFEDDGLKILEVYGDTLASLRVPKHEVDEQLQRDGLVKFLRPGWRGTASVVLTTYETLRDLEFSFAAEEWSFLICDEAQKVKNPNALVTRAAKKQKARFRVACTGTPVENSLTDLWCLFDFVQPGLLGSLNEFGQLYRRPIEAKTDEQKTQVEKLRALTSVQILRRMKHEVAKDLPEKRSEVACRSLHLSAYQRGLYSQAVTQFSKRMEADSVTPFKNALGLLQYLRLICTDPRPYGLTGFRAESLSSYRTKAPKMDWLLSTLKSIRTRNEKALVFCEFKDMQLLIRHYIQADLAFSADIINGDTSASSESDQSRQKRIRHFQERPGFGVIILSPLAVGFGLNIQAANHVIHYTRTWNPAKEDQATDRAFRIGQEKDVYVYCPMVRADDFKTFDVRLDELLEYKRGLALDMLNGAGDLGSNDFDLSEVAPPESPRSAPRLLSFDDILAMHSRHFEAYTAVLWSRIGYPNVRLTPAAGDGGVDVVAIKGTEGQLIQCKTSQRSNRDLSWEAIKDVVTGEASYRHQYPGVNFKKICVATQMFNSGARTHASLNSVELFDKERLEEASSKHAISLEEVERVLSAGNIRT